MIVDLILILLLVWGGYKGYKSGFVLEILSWFSFSIAKVISISILHLAQTLYSKWYDNMGTLPAYISFAVCFIAIVAIIYLLGKVLKSRLHKTVLKGIDKWAGLTVGIGKWAFYISTCIWLAGLLGIHLPESYIANTLLYPLIRALSPTFIAMLSSWLPALQKYLEAIKTI
jgi:membrane protein required for colicin V production